MSNFWNKILIGFAFILATATVALAQPKDNSPYTRLGIGDLTDQFFFAQGAMGGLGAAFWDAGHINIANPASYSRLRVASFDLGINAEYARLNDATGKNNSITTWNGNLSHLSLGFPLKNPINEVLDQKKKKIRWGMNFSLLPFSNVDYNIVNNTTQTFSDTITAVDFLFQGKGGTYKVMWGNSVNYKNFSVGLNLGYFFGKIENIKLVNFPELPSPFNNEFVDNFSVGGLTWALGTQYDFILETKKETGQNTKYITVGAYGNSRNKFNITRDREWVTKNFSYPQSNLDTIFSVTGSETIKSNSYLPGELGIGIMYNHMPNQDRSRKSFLRLGIDFKYQSWSEYVNDLIAATDPNKPTVSTWRLAVGGEYVPDERSYNNYLKKVRYRMGAFYSKDPRSVLDQNILKYGFSVGMGLPLIQKQSATSYVNLGLEIGQIGISDALQRTYFKINVGFTLNDNTWFFKRKFN